MKINENKSRSLCDLYSSHTVFSKLAIQPHYLSKTVKKNASAFAELEHTGEERIFYHSFSIISILRTVFTLYILI